MLMSFPHAESRPADRRQAEVALDEALLKQPGLLATLITDRRGGSRIPVLDQAELMRLVKSQQSLLSAGGENGRGYRTAVMKGLGAPALNDAGQVLTFERIAA